jgi:hypothetical protein
MAAMFDGKLGDDAHAAMVRHLAECQECREIVAELARAHETGKPRSSSVTTARTWLPIAATLLLAITAGVLLQINRVTDRDAAPLSPVEVTPASPPLPSAPPSSAPVVVPEPPEDVSTRRSGERIINGKTFRLVAGEWVDSAYDPLALLPLEPVPPASRSAVFARVPALQRYASLGPRFVVVHDGVVYRFGPP